MDTKVGLHGVIWYRCVVRLPKDWATNDLQIKTGELDGPTQVWTNGQPAKLVGKAGVFAVAPNSLVADDYNLLVVRHDTKLLGLDGAPELVKGSSQFELKGSWQTRQGDDAAWANIPLPAKFGGATDMLFEAK